MRGSLRRDLVLNEISVPLQHENEDSVGAELTDFAGVIAALVTAGVSNNVLRLVSPLHELKLVGRITLYEALLQLRRDPKGVEASRYLMRLSQKCPLLSDAPEEVASRFQAVDSCAYERKPMGLLYCYVANSVSISFPSSPTWDAERITLDVLELDEVGDLTPLSVCVDNVSRLAHAKVLSDRLRAQTALQLGTRNFWERRQEVFLCLQFGADVEDQVLHLDEATFRLVLTRLVELDDCLSEWRSSESAFPVWRTEVTPESSSTMSNPKLAAQRVFRGATGQPMTFEWHSRYGSSGRVHFAIDSAKKQIVVGYIGPHLPLG